MANRGSNRGGRVGFGPDACNTVKPFAADCRAVKPYCGPLRLSAKELKLFDSITSEQVKIAGQSIEYWQLDIAGSVRDPLYDEPTLRKFRGPLVLNAWVGYANSTPDLPPQGYRDTFATSAWIARTEVEKAKMSRPVEGDIIGFWKIPYFAEDSADTEFTPGGGYYFNVVNVSEDGHLFDNAEFVGFTLEIARNTEFTPERRIEAR
jgi:hypothetical protein